MKSNYFTESEAQRIVSAIRAMEKTTSAEIRLHVESRCWRDPLRRAAFVFSRLGMHETNERNAVLLYLAMKSRKFAVMGDQAARQALPENIWETVSRKMSGLFIEQLYCEGICTAIGVLGKELSTSFPARPGQKNQLSDLISEDD